MNVYAHLSQEGLDNFPIATKVDVYRIRHSTNSEYLYWRLKETYKDSKIEHTFDDATLTFTRTEYHQMYEIPMEFVKEYLKTYLSKCLYYDEDLEELVLSEYA